MSVVGNSKNIKLFSEKQVLAEMLKLYKERPCLWNLQHEQYGQKAARDKGFMELLEKYQLIDENATIEQVKKKIEHMRCAYRREVKKVLAAREKGLVHRPCLWYFDYLTFLNEELDTMSTSMDSIKHETPVVTYLQETEDGDYEFEVVPKKRSKLEQMLLSAPSSPVHNSNDDSTENDNIEQSEQEPSEAHHHQEAESFGRTVGLQLRELDSTQRFIAEKLISEIIFYARMDQLKTNSSIVTDSD